MSRWMNAAVISIALVQSACSADQEGGGAAPASAGGIGAIGALPGGGSGGAPPSTNGSAGSVMLGSVGLAGAGGSSASDDCPESAKLVYVISETGLLSSFHPGTSVFTTIGQVSCASAMYSMAVDRSGIAWVLAESGALWKVSTEDAHCSPTSFTAGDYNPFGMAYVSNAAGASSEALFVFNEKRGVAGLDTTTLTLTPLAAASPENARAELTGTGAGDLYAFFPFILGQPTSTLAQLDKADGHILSREEIDLDLDSPSAWFAFAFWGGDFWLFTSSKTAPRPSPSHVHRYQPSTKQVSLAVADVGFNIVGAGVSTCAPMTSIVK